jgi:hypothetical protein
MRTSLHGVFALFQAAAAPAAFTPNATCTSTHTVTSLGTVAACLPTWPPAHAQRVSGCGCDAASSRTRCPRLRTHIQSRHFSSSGTLQLSRLTRPRVNNLRLCDAAHPAATAAKQAPLLPESSNVPCRPANSRAPHATGALHLHAQGRRQYKGGGGRGQAWKGCWDCTGLHLLQSSGRARAAGGTRRRHQRRRAVQSGPRHALQQRQEEDAPAGQRDAACLLARRTAAAVAGARRRAAGRRDGAAAGCSCRGMRRAQLDDD